MVDLETVLPEEKSATYHLKLRDLLEQSAVLFARKGYHNTSIRDIAAEMNTSLAGLYYYFDTKEELLYLISKNSFDSVLQSLQEKLNGVQSPAEQLQALVQNHLHYFVTHLDSMKVLAHESDSLTGDYYEKIHEKKKFYVDLVEKILLDIQRESAKNSRVNQEIRIAALSLFGMMNWVYTWYNPGKREHSPANIVKISKQMVDLFLNGFVKTKI
jgi:AcrR family transcriptional regulator